MRTNLRSRPLLDLAHEIQQCQIRIPDVCSGFTEGCEPSHANWLWAGKGMGVKASDIFAAACHACHVEIDQGKKLAREDKEYYWLRGCARTWEYLMKTGKLITERSPHGVK